MAMLFFNYRAISHIDLTEFQFLDPPDLVEDRRRRPLMLRGKKLGIPA